MTEGFYLRGFIHCDISKVKPQLNPGEGCTKYSSEIFYHLNMTFKTEILLTVLLKGVHAIHTERILRLYCIKMDLQK